MNQYSNMPNPNDPFSTGIRIRNFLLIETVELNYNDMFVRPFAFTQITDKNINNLEDAIKNSYGGRDSMSEVSCVQSFGSMFGLSSRPVSGIILPNGNRTQRFKFLLDLEKPVGPGSRNTSRYIIQGFTSTNEAMEKSGSVFLPYDLEFHINSITEFYSSVRSDGTISVSLSDSFNTISGMNLHNQQEAMKLVSSRARDINQVLLLKEEDFNANIGIESPSLDVSSIGAIGYTDVLTSARVNSDPVEFLRRLLNSYREGHGLSTHGGYADDNSRLGKMNALDNATRSCAEPIFLRNAVIQFLMSVADTSRSTNILQYCLLQSAFGDLRNVVKVIFGQNARTLESSIYGRRRDIGINMDKQDPISTARTDMITTKVLELNNSLSSHMSRLGLTEGCIRLGYSPSEGFLANQNTVVASVLTAKSILGDSYVIPSVNRLETVLRSLIMPMFMSILGDTPFSIVIDVNMFADTVMDVYIPAFQFSETYRFPTFCDSLYMPVISTREERSILCNDVETVHSIMEGV